MLSFRSEAPEALPVKRREFITLSCKAWATHGVRLAYLRRASAIGLAPLRISVSLIVLTGACWALMLHHAISMTASMDSAGGGAMGVEVIGAEFTLGGLGVFLAVWTVMMGAMMLPSAAPMILTFAAAQARHDRNVVVPTWIFVAAYIFVWGFAGLVVYLPSPCWKGFGEERRPRVALARGHVDPCRAVSIHASQAALSPPLPLALGLSQAALARRL